MPRTLAIWIAFTTAGAMFALVMILAAVVLGAPGGNATAPSPSAAAPSGPVGTIEVRAFDLGFEPSMVHVDAAGTYAVTFTNDGGVLHDLTFADGTKIAAEAHSAANGEVTIPSGGLTFICSVPGHADAGMKGEVMIGAGEPGASASPDASMTAQQMAAADAARTGQFPAETKGKGNQVLEPTILPDGTKQWELTASEIQWETEPGIFVDAYAYNGTVPGPQLHADVGDKVRIILHNELPVPTTMHSHGLYVPNDMDGVPVISQPAIMPGKSFTYEYTVRNAGSHMYHSHFMAEEQVPMGLLGAFIVSDPKAQEPKVDLDYAMIVNDGPLGFTLNGKGFPATEPLVVKQGDLVRIRYMNEGLQIHPMHLHGMRQQVIAMDGYMLPEPYYQDTVLVAPGQRIDVLVRATELGVWAFHCHILTHAEGPNGMFGMVTALIVEER